MAHMYFPFFPIPAAGETVYSTFCRCIERSGLAERHVLESLTGQRYKTALLSALPGYLSTFASRLPAGHPWKEVHQLILHHTNLPYFTYFDCFAQRSAAVDLLATTELSQRVSMALGLTQYRSQAMYKHPRFCIDCVGEDEYGMGFSSFYREHQLPGVALCWKHSRDLSIGCKNCGPYPIVGRAMSMAGRCNCKSPISTIPACPTLPADREALLWLATESAYMVASSGSPHQNSTLVLRRMAVDLGLHIGSRLRYYKIAEKIETRFGPETLNWLGYPAWSDGQPSAWIRKSFPTDEDNCRRKPALSRLLVLGALFDSVAEFESGKWSSSGEPLIESTSGKSLVDVMASRTFEEVTTDFCESKHALEEKLQINDYRISRTALMVGVSPLAIATQARDHKIRVPLSTVATKRLGVKKLGAIRTALRMGVQKLQIQKVRQVSEWTLLLIELDDPTLHDAWRGAVLNKIRASHRKKVTDLVKQYPSSTRIDVQIAMAGTYDYMLNNDKEWFVAQFPLIARTSGRAGDRTDWKGLDKTLADQISKLASKILVSEGKPRRITVRMLLRETKAYGKYLTSPTQFPMTTAVLAKVVEAKDSFLDRKVQWGISQMSKTGQLISVNSLRRVVGVSPEKVRQRRELVVTEAARTAAVLAPRSYFAAP